MNKITTTQPQQETPELKVGQIWEDFVDEVFYLLTQIERKHVLVDLSNGAPFTVEGKYSIQEVFGSHRKDFRLATTPITITPNLPDT